MRGIVNGEIKDRPHLFSNFGFIFLLFITNIVPFFSGFEIDLSICIFIFKCTPTIFPPLSGSRSSADAHRGNGVSLPAAQLYKEHPQSTSYRLSNNENMTVDGTGASNFFYANANPELALTSVSEHGTGPNEMKEYRTNVKFINDCGLYATNQFRAIHQLTRKDVGLKKIKGTDTNVPYEIGDLFAQQLSSGSVDPQLGEAYLAVSNPKSELVKSKEHYNFHWAVVVAKDGNDVITVESQPSASREWFQMYNQATESQTFRQQYVFNLKKLDEAAKFFAVTFHKKQEEKKEENKEEIILD